MDMKKLACVLVLAAMTSPSWAACNYPKKVTKMPDGKSASRDEMVATQKTVKQYQTDMSTYLECIKTEHHASLAKDAATLSEDQKKALTTRYTQQNDAAVDEEQEVAERFNEQLRAFNKAKAN
jgi:hypothetical protein